MAGRRLTSKHAHLVVLVALLLRKKDGAAVDFSARELHRAALCVVVRHVYVRAAHVEDLLETVHAFEARRVLRLLLREAVAKDAAVVHRRLDCSVRSVLIAHDRRRQDVRYDNEVGGDVLHLGRVS